MVQPVAPPTAAALRIGLATGALRPEGDRWQLGIAYDPDHDHLGDGYVEVSEGASGIVELDTSALDPGDMLKTIPDGQENNSWLPYTLWLGEKCGTLSGLGADFYRPKVRNSLLVQTSHILERIFSSGVVTINATEEYTFAELGLPNRALEDEEATELNSSVAVDPVEAIERLVDAMGDELGSARGVVHMPDALLPWMDYYRQIIRNPSDGRFITLRSHDHTVIAGTGYRGFAPDGTDPGEGVYWIYGTSPVEVRLDEIEVIPEEHSDAVHTRQNLVEYRAERLALASWDLSCHVAIPVAVNQPLTS